MAWMKAEDCYWQTKDGRRIRVDQLGDRHLENIIKMLERMAEQEISAALHTLPMLHGEMAIDACESVAFASLDEVLDSWPIYGVLVDEQIQRKTREE